MDQTIETRRSRSSAEEEEGSLLNSFCMAALGFLTVVLAHQFFLGLVSYLLGYETHVTFGKVVSMPFDNKYWSSNRVLFMYAFPSLVFLFAAALIAFYLLYIVTAVDRLYWYLFWCMVFCVFLISNQLTLAPVASLFGKGPIYQGVAVVANWWGVDTFKLLGVSFLSFLINIVFGILSFRLVMQLSPSRTTMRSREYQRNVILYYFVIPVVLVIPVAVLLSYPDLSIFFTVMLLHVLLWLPGLWMKTQHGYRVDGIAVRASEVSTSYVLVGVLLVAIILIRIFL